MEFRHLVNKNRRNMVNEKRWEEELEGKLNWKNCFQNERKVEIICMNTYLSRERKRVRGIMHLTLRVVCNDSHSKSLSLIQGS